MQIEAMDHVQLAMPKGGEPAAIEFYQGLLGLERVPKPEPLANRGGCWFAAGAVQVHLGVEEPFRPARKAHPALRVRGLAEGLAALRAAHVPVREDQDLPGHDRAFVDDPFGNRLELVERRGASELEGARSLAWNSVSWTLKQIESTLSGVDPALVCEQPPGLPNHGSLDRRAPGIQPAGHRRGARSPGLVARSMGRAIRSGIGPRRLPRGGCGMDASAGGSAGRCRACARSLGAAS